MRLRLSGRSAFLVASWIVAALAVAGMVALAVRNGTSSDRIQDLEAQVEELQQAQADLEAEQAGSEELSARVAELEAENEALAKRNTKLRKQNNALEGRLEELCSAGGLSVRLASQEGLPTAVARTRRAILQAATACDFERLASLTSGSDFVFSFGGGGDPAAYWREAEDFGDQPLGYLAKLLELPYRERTFEGETYYVWPSAYGYGDWSSVPAEDKEALESVYDQALLDSFAEFGAYAGYRVGITETGEWRFFVAGD